jgi:hypothetical protein
MRRVSRGRTARAQAGVVLDGDTSLLDLVDHVLTKGVVVNGDLVLGVADVDLVYVRLSAVLCAADRIFAGKSERKSKRRR